jgi:hypothetical protein
MMVYSCNYHNSGHYPLSCLLFKTQRFADWILSMSSGGTYSAGLNRRKQGLPLSNRPTWDGDKTQSSKCFILNKTQYDGQCLEL